MLIGIDPLLNADVLHTLRAMGHGDVVVVADANFPAHAVARDTVIGRSLHIDASTPRVVEAVLSVMPLDGFIDKPVSAMEVVGAPDEVPPVRTEVVSILDRTGDASRVGLVERHAFYALARSAFAVIQTAERRFYGCIAITKGVIEPDG